jgi:hypothetical protein
MLLLGACGGGGSTTAPSTAATSAGSTTTAKASSATTTAASSKPGAKLDASLCPTAAQIDALTGLAGTKANPGSVSAGGTLACPYHWAEGSDTTQLLTHLTVHPDMARADSVLADRKLHAADAAVTQYAKVGTAYTNAPGLAAGGFSWKERHTATAVFEHRLYDRKSVAVVDIFVHDNQARLGPNDGLSTIAAKAAKALLAKV